MRRLEQLCTQYLENTINHQNVLTALHYASKLNLFFIKEYCLKFIVKESNFTQIVMTHEFETVERELMVDIIRRRQMPQIRQLLEPHFETVRETSLNTSLVSLSKAIFSISKILLQCLNSILISSFFKPTDSIFIFFPLTRQNLNFHLTRQFLNFPPFFL